MMLHSGLPLPSPLPVQLTPLIGREAAVNTVSTLLQRPEVRLLTLTGPAGIGKTRLGLEVALSLQREFAHGACFVSLAALSDHDLVLPTIAQTFGLRETGDWPLQERVQRFLAEKQLLLLLDNFEQVLAGARALPDLLSTCPQVKVLVTSRAVLHVRGEYEFLVPPLALPSLVPGTASALLATSPAVALFLERAQAVRPEFHLTDVSARAVAEICIRLDGIPLAIELAAARSRLFSPPVLLSHLQHRLPLLTNPTRDVPARQQTLRAALAWSYDLLTPEEQRVFRRLSVFVGAWTLDAAEAVIGQEPGGRPLLDYVAALLDQSMILPLDQVEHDATFRLLETIREYGWESLVAQGEAPATQQAHAAYYLGFAEEAERQLRGAGQQTWLTRVEQHYENLRAALAWWLDQRKLEEAFRLGSALWWFWWLRGNVREGRRFLEQMLAFRENVSPAIRARVLHAAGALAGLQGHLEQAEQLCTESLALFRDLEDAQGIVLSLWVLAYGVMERSHYGEARALIEEAVALAREVHDAWGLAYALEILADVEFNQGNYAQARRLGEESLTLSRKLGDSAGMALRLRLLALVRFFEGIPGEALPFAEESLLHSRAVGDRRGSAYSLFIQGFIAIFQGQYRSAQQKLKDGLALLEEVGDRRGLGWGLYGLGWAALGQGEVPAAQGRLDEALELFAEMDQQWFCALCLEGLACAVAAQGKAVWAARLWGAAEHLREAISGVIPTLVQRLYEPFLVMARTHLGDEAFAAAWAEGGVLTIQEVRGPQGQAPLATSVIPSWTTASNTERTSFPAGLTEREVEVLRLVAQGLTDKRVAEQLVIAPRTVGTHLSSIYQKLGVSSRAAATRFAVEHGLV
jgi:predicted ATPase/DNA-binding CsgD family transcriptional regulator